MSSEAVNKSMYRLGHLLNGEWVEHSHPPVFELGKRLVAGVPGGDASLFETLLECLAPPYFLLYVLHTPRGEGQAGRYQSPPLSREQTVAFLRRFAPYLAADGRFDLWAHSPGDNATLAWDRHNRLFGYGPLDCFAARLRSMGFGAGYPDIPVPHEHYYRPECDGSAGELLASFKWSHSPLRPEDEQ